MNNQAPSNPTFTDQKNKTWSLCLNGPLIRRIQQATSINLADLKSDPFDRLALEPLLLFDVLWLICESQAKEASITDIEFGERLAPCIDDAVVALEAAATDFFPSSKRSFLRSLRCKNAAMTETATKTAMKTLEASEAEIEAAMTRKMQQEMKQLLESFGSATSGE